MNERSLSNLQPFGPGQSGNLELASAEPSASTLARLAEALRTSMDWLYRGDPPPSPGAHHQRE